MTIKRIIEDYKEKINYLDILHIIAFVLKKNQTFVLANFNFSISDFKYQKIREMLNLRANHYPLAYLKKEAFFYHLKFRVTESVLIPRSSTERIIDLIMENDLSREKQTFIDIGCGSGAIIITLADLLRKYRLYSFYGLDISQEALEIAKYNSRRYRLKIKFSQSNLLSDYKIKTSDRKIITANLPYLNLEDLKELSIKYEPKVALFAEENGLALYRQLISQLKDYNNLKAYLEIKPEQEREIKKIAKPDFEIIFKDDLSKKIKIAILER